MRIQRLIICVLSAMCAAVLPAALVLPVAASGKTRSYRAHHAKGKKPHADSASCPTNSGSGNSGSGAGNSGSGNGGSTGDSGSGQGNSGASGGSGMSGGSGSTSASGTPCQGDSGTESGGASAGPPPAGTSTPEQPIVEGYTAKIINGLAYAPSYAPMAVKKAIWAGDKIRKKPYVWGGGHGSFNSDGYDCSGSVSYVLHAAGLLSTPYDSSDFESYGARGAGSWITIYTNPDHAFVEIAGIRFDTSAEDDPNPAPGSGPRWRPLYPHPDGFQARHPRSY